MIHANRIGFVGAHATGKTSLSRALLAREEMKEYLFVPSSSRRLSEILPTSRDATPFSQLLITTARVADEESISMGGRRKILSERTALDSLAYTHYQVKEQWEGSELLEEYLDITKLMVKRVMRDYDVVVYFPVYGWGIEDDGLRDLDEEYRKMISVYCMMYLTQFGIKPYVVQNESVDERADHLIEWLKRRM